MIGVMKRYLQLSSRKSRMKPQSDVVVPDKEINGVDDLAADYKCRGFVISIAGDHCLVALGRKVTANLPLGQGHVSHHINRSVSCHTLICVRVCARRASSRSDRPSRYKC